MVEKRRFLLNQTFASVVPMVGFPIAFFIVQRAWPMTDDSYERYRAFWGGAPSEVLSHWLDMVLMSGNAITLAWLTSVESFFRRSNSLDKATSWSLKCIAIITIVATSIICAVFDHRDGEGTVLFAFALFFLPILLSSAYILRKAAAAFSWKYRSVTILCAGFAAGHIAAQLFYEPSGTGAPNLLILPLWFGCPAFALVWSLVHNFRSGRLHVLLASSLRVFRKPLVWGGLIVLILAIGIPTTLQAYRIRNGHRGSLLQCLDNMESALTDSFVAEVKHDHITSRADQNGKIPISGSVHTLFTRLAATNLDSVRLYVPLGNDDYLFLWWNQTFEYCDIRKLHRTVTVEIDQGFIDSLLNHGGTYETGLYSVLWSPYLVGRVLKDKVGDAKTICVVKSAD